MRPARGRGGARGEAGVVREAGVPCGAHFGGRIDPGRDAEPVDPRRAGPVLGQASRTSRAGRNEAARRQPVLDPECDLCFAVPLRAGEVSVEVASDIEGGAPL
eukprot:10292917-Alexandrium_andersonii.AAC.1